MNKNLYFKLAGVICIALIAVFVYGLYFASDPREIPSAQIGRKAFPFEVKTFDGQQLTLEQFKGKPVIVNFWASWCTTCWKEAHILESTHQRFTPMGAVVIGIAINDEREASLRFIRKYKKTYYLAPDDKTGSISLDYGVTAVPETFLIDKEGVIKHKVLGAIESNVLEKFLIEQLQSS